MSDLAVFTDSPRLRSMCMSHVRCAVDEVAVEV